MRTIFLSILACLILGSLIVAQQNSSVATSNGASVSFQTTTGDAAASQPVSIAFQNSVDFSSNSQGISIGFGEPRELEVNPNNPIQGDTVQALGTNFTPFGNAVLYLIGPNNTERVVGSSVANSSGQVLINYTTSCANLEGDNSFRMLDAAFGIYSDVDVIAVFPNKSECEVYSHTALVEAYQGDLGSRTPVILIHGIHGNRWDEVRWPNHCGGAIPADCAWDPFLHYFHDLILYLNDSGSSYNNNYKTYKFHYESDKYTTKNIAKALRDRIDSTPEFANKEIILVAHSMGGIVARHYMLQTANSGPYPGQASGQRVQKLITLGTLHHGTYGSNQKSRGDHFITGLRSVANSVLGDLDRRYWRGGGCEACISNPQHPNRISLLWDNEDNMLNLYSNEISSDLPNPTNYPSPTPRNFYNDRIIAYSGDISADDANWQLVTQTVQNVGNPGVIAWRLLDFYADDGGVNDLKLAVGGYFIESIRRQYFPIQPFPWPAPPIQPPLNDGLVPVKSARFEGANLMGRFHCNGYNHLKMETGYHKPCKNEQDQIVGTLFESVTYQITGVPVAFRSHLSGPNRAGFGYHTYNTARPVGSSPIDTTDVELSNLGSTPLQITSLSLTGANADQFVIVNPLTLPLTIGAESSVHITVGFNPTSPGEKTAELRAENSSSNSVVVVNISATGVPEECDLDFSPASQFMPTSGGSGEVMVGNISCPWTVSAVDDWIHPTALADRVSFTVDANPTAEVRYGTMIVSVYGRSYLYSISQDAKNAPCWLQLSSDQSVVQREAGGSSFYITTPPTCNWNLQSDSPWLVPSVTTLPGSGTVGFTVADNVGLDRSGIITITGAAMNAQFTVHQRGASITGTVTYGNAAAPPKYISNVTVDGTGSPSVSTVTDPPGATAGQYTLTGFGAGAYTVALSKTTGQNGINSFDAARIAQHVTGISLLTNDDQRVSADVTGNNAISSQDAARIAQFVAGASPLPLPNLSGQWRFFVPPGPTFPVGSSPTSRTYASVTSNITGDDYVGLLIGEVTGNWNPTAARHSDAGGTGVAGRDARAPVSDIVVDLPNLAAVVDKEIVVPVNVQGIALKDVISYEFDLRYDPTVMQPLVDVADVKGTASRALSVVTNTTEPGLLRVVVYGASPIDEDGVLLNLRFTAVGKPGSTSTLAFERLMFNEGDPQPSVLNGQISLF